MKTSLLILTSFVLIVGFLPSCDNDDIPEYLAKNDIECEFHGTLVSGSCQCLEGYVGSTCGQCATTYQDNDDNHSCLPDCSHMDSCFLNSSCQDEQGAAQCICEEGYYQLAGGGCMTPFLVNSSTGKSTGTSVASLLNGMAYVVGDFSGTFQFSQTSSTITSVDDQFDSYLVALHPDGTVDWTKGILGSGDDHATAVAVTAAGDVLVAGYFEQDLNFGKDVDEKTVTLEATGDDLFLAKYSSEGVLLWAKRAGDTGSFYPKGIALSGDEFYLTGAIFGSVKIGLGDNEISLETQTSDKPDAFLVKFNKDGFPLWAKTVSGTNSDTMAFSVAVAGGGPVIAGQFTNTISFDSTSSFSLEAYQSETDAFVAKYDAEGQFLWATKFGGLGPDSVNSITDNLMVTGYLMDDLLISQLSSNGEIEWTKRIVSSGIARGRAIVTTWDGKFAVAGYLVGTVTFGEGKSAVELSGKDGNIFGDLFIAKYKRDGTFEWATVSKSDNSVSPTDMAMLRDGTIFVTGMHTDSVTFWSGEEQEVEITKETDGEMQAFLLGVYAPYTGPTVEEEQQDEL